ncbi:MAG: WYL domain-containing protein [Bacteroidales bacterium]|nr:WYL domain-containing protein [Bacteroidales bacterium]
MAKNYFDRYIWLIETIDRAGHIFFEDIDRAWQRSNLNPTRERLPQRTFFNHLEAIQDTFGIEIKCNRTEGYYIANDEDLAEDGGIRSWMMDSLSLNNLLTECRDMRDRILFERIPSSKQWLAVLINAMKDGKAVEMTYQSFWRDEPSTFVTSPWCVKIFRQRWYLLAKSDAFDEPRIYGLDRIHDVHPVDKKLKMPSKFSPAGFFSRFYGVCISDEPVETVRLKVDRSQVKFLDSLPLHDSQRRVEDKPEYAIYELTLVPTFDFQQELLSRGREIEVLAPESLRNAMSEEIAVMARNYGLVK